jgi:hypothetical protein
MVSTSRSENTSRPSSDASAGDSGTRRTRFSSPSGPEPPSRCPDAGHDLNLGLNDATTQGLADVSNSPAFAADCRSRFETMFRDIVGVDIVPDDPWLQLRSAIEAVFRSWNSERARTYRQREAIPDDLGTAATVQAMVFGNGSVDSGSGVLFTRNPATGEPTTYGDVMFDAQGEDVVSGTHPTDTRRLAVHAADCRPELDRYAGPRRHPPTCATSIHDRARHAMLLSVGSGSGPRLFDRRRHGGAEDFR